MEFIKKLLLEIGGISNQDDRYGEKIARRMGKMSSQISRYAKRLVDNGLVTESTGNGGRVLYTLTDTGQKEYQKVKSESKAEVQEEPAGKYTVVPAHPARLKAKKVKK